MKRLACWVLSAVLFLSFIPCALADRVIEEKPWYYLGAHQVVWCKEWISLREEPKKTSRRILKIPLGAIVYNVKDIKDELFYEVEYEGVTGYALKGYLKATPQYEPPASSATTVKMSLDEVIGNGEVVLEWKDYNMSVVAAHEFVREKRKKWEVLRIGCFIDGQPIWGHEEKVEADYAKYDLLKVFIGGVADDWQVMLYDGGYGLSMLDLLSGRERWCVSSKDTALGDAAAIAVDQNGTTYIAGTDGPDPVAISLDGRVMWESEIEDPEVFAPYEIYFDNGTVKVRYRSGLENGYKLVTLDSTGEVLSIQEEYLTANAQE